MASHLKYRFDDVEVDPGGKCVTRGGEEQHLRQKAYQVFVYLIENRDRVVSKQELFEAIWKNTSVTDDVLVQAIKEIRRAVKDDIHQPRFIKTVPRLGYRFIGELELPATPLAAVRARQITPVQYAAVGFIAVLLLLSIGAYLQVPAGLFSRSRASNIAAGRKTVAVVTFNNLSGGAELDWLRDGIADMLTAGLSRSEKLALVDRGQLSELSRRQTPEVRTPDLADYTRLAQQANAEVLIAGGFSQIGPKLRLDVNIHNASDGLLLGSEGLTVDKVEDILTQIDVLSLRVLNRLNADVNSGPQLATVLTDNLEAYRHYSLGVSKANALENREAVDLLQKAVELDPNFAMAHARLGYAFAVTWGRNAEGKPYLEKAFGLPARLTERDRLNVAAWYAIASSDFPAAIDAYREVIRHFPLDVEAYWRLGRLLIGEERLEEAITALKEGIAIDPHSKDLYNSLGNVLSLSARHEEAIAAHERYVALASNEPNAYDSLGLTYQWAGNFDGAITMFSRALEINPNFDIARIHLAQSLVRTGQYRAAMDHLRRFINDVSIPREKARGYDVLSYLYFRMGDLRSAESAALQNLALDPTSPSMSYLLTVTRRDARKVSRLEAQLRSLNQLPDRGARGSKRWPAYFQGMIALDAGRHDEAVGFFREALTHTPPTWSHEDLEDCLGRALIELGRYDEAIAEFERVLSVSPNYSRARFHIAKAYQAKGLTAEARSNFELFLSEWKGADADAPEVVLARRSL